MISQSALNLSGKQFRIPSDLSLVDGLREAFGDFLCQWLIEEENVADWKLVLSEAVTNAMVHGNERNPEKKVEVSWYVRGSQIILEIEDEGSGFPLGNIKDARLPADPLSTGGRGLYIIRRFCDDWKQWKGDQGCRQIIIKNHDELDDENTIELELEQAMDEIALCYESLAAFYRLGDSLIKSENVTGFVESAMHDLKNLVKGDEVGIHFVDSLQGVIFRSLIEIDAVLEQCGDSPVQSSVLESGEEFVWETPEEVAHDGVLSRFKSGCCCSVKAGGNILGFLTLSRLSNEPYLNAGELNTLRTFSDLIGISVANANSEIVRTREQQALRELEIAASVQDKLLPTRSLPESERWRVFVQRTSAREVAGDYVEACISDQGSLYLVIVDVMGKGVSAAFLAAMFRTALHMNMDRDLSLNELVNSLNVALCREVGETVMFATCSIARVSRDLSEMEVVNAGHCPVLLLDQGKIVKQVDPSGPPLGLFQDMEYIAETFHCDPQNGVLMVTDGLYEWEYEEQMGTWEDFMEFLKTCEPFDPEQFWIRLQDKINDTSDDQTMLYWELKG